MENRYVLFHVALMLNILILVVSFTGVISTPLIIQKPNITEVMKNDTNLCETSKFLYESEYAKLCASLPYPIAPLDFNEQNLNIFLCLGLYDTAYKICQYSSQTFVNTTILTPNLEKFAPNATFDAILENEKEFCDKLHGFTSSYNKIDSLLKPLVEMLNKLYKCQKMCFEFNDKLKPLCAVFAWIKKYDDIKKASRTETKNLVISDLILNETSDKIEHKKISESNEQNINKLITISKNNNIKKTHLNGSQTVTTIHAEFHAEKVKSDSEKSSEAQKKLDIDLKTSAHKSSSPMLDENKNKIIDKTETNVKIAKPTKTTTPNSDLQVPSMNNPTSNVPKKDVSEEKGEKFKEQNIDDLKTSTLSENTQDHYDARNPEEDTETNIDSNIEDADTIQQSTRNQNENVPELFKQENLRNPNIRTEDDSHLFTYFTVVTVACIAGYIGYHNKQKILAIVLEGRRSRSNRSRRRPSTANYRKLDCTLEEAVTSQCNANVTHVIY
ncbi:Trans-Golgi network integral membrane protein 2 [Camponotus japonicus]